MNLARAGRRLINEPSLARAGRRRLLALSFGFWQRLGIHVIPNDFYQPIPDTRSLRSQVWSQLSAMPGVEMNEQEQLALLDRLVGEFAGEYENLPLEEPDGGGYFINNSMFESVDGEILYSLVRSLRPRRMIEIGSGYSTLLSAKALGLNSTEGHDCDFTAIEPYPSRFLRHLPGDRVRLLTQGVQEVPLAEFEALGENDVLFIDSSHVVCIGSDVQYELLEVLPRLRPGVIVHVHDIFLPSEYPREWVLGDKRFWNEQYVLQALLAGGSLFDVIWGSSFMHLHHPDRLAAAFPSYRSQRRWPASFWMRRRAPGDRNLKTAAPAISTVLDG